MAEAVPQGNPVAIARAEMGKLEGEFANALPAHIPVERFMRVVMTAIQNNPKLLQCDRRSLWNSAMKAAQDGLLPDGRDGAIVEYKGVAQWMPMIGGIRKKVRNSGEIATWDVQAVFENDAFEFELGDEPFIRHRPALNNRGKIIAVYSIATLKTGEKSRDVMSIEDVEKIRAKSRAANGPWSDPTFYPEMAKKTVARRHSKVLPMSSDLDDLIRRDDNLYDLEASSDAAVKLPGKRGLADRMASLAGAGVDAQALLGQSGEVIDATTGEVREVERVKPAEEKPKEARPAPEATTVAKEGKTAEGAPNPAEAGGNEADGKREGDGQAEDGEADDAAPTFSAEQIDAAFDRGAEAKRAGRSRKATPPEWREPGFEQLLTAYLQGFDHAARE